MTVDVKLIVTDAAPLITLAAAQSLDYLLYPALPVIIPDAVYYEATGSAGKLGAQQIIDWYHAHGDAVRIEPTHPQRNAAALPRLPHTARSLPGAARHPPPGSIRSQPTLSHFAAKPPRTGSGRSVGIIEQAVQPHGVLQHSLGAPPAVAWSGLHCLVRLVDQETHDRLPGDARC